MAKYLDETETDSVAAHCPLCRGDVVTRWHGVVAHSGKRSPSYSPRAVPLRVCPSCEIAVQVRALPEGSLHATREAARKSIAKKIADRNQQRGRVP